MSAATLGPQWDEVVAIRTTEGSEANDPASEWLGVYVLAGQYVAQFDSTMYADSNHSGWGQNVHGSLRQL